MGIDLQKQEFLLQLRETPILMTLLFFLSVSCINVSYGSLTAERGTENAKVGVKPPSLTANLILVT